MCMTEQSELAYKAMDETAEWGVTHLRQPRRDNVIPMLTKPVHELHAHVKPEHTTGSVLSDFAAFWSVGHLASVLIALLCIAIVSMLAGWAYQELRMADLSPLLAVIGVAL